MSSPSASPAPHVLIVDDSLDQLRLLIELLRNAHFRISIARDGTQAYARALSSAPDLILMDVQMPRMDGFSACRLLKTNPATREIPIMFLTAAISLDERLEGLGNGGVDYVLKPFDPAEVLARIRIHLRRSLRSAPAEPAVQEKLNGDQVLVEAACRYLCERLAYPPGVEELAQRVGTNEKRLARVFREQLGVTVFEFVRDERLRLAQRLLNETSLRIADIAEEIGFSNSANFATAFREQTGTTPSTYRRRQQSATSNGTAADSVD